MADSFINDLEQTEALRIGLMCEQSGLGFHYPERNDLPGSQVEGGSPTYPPVQKPL